VFGSTFFPRLHVKGRRTRLGAQAEWNPGPLGLRGEIMRTTEEREGQGLGDGDLSDFLGRAWYVSVTWVLTNERKAGGIPRGALFQGGVGAIEIGARLESLRFSSASREGPAFPHPRADHVLPNEDRIWTSGVNWYVNRWVKIQGNAIREMFDDEARTPVAGRGSFWSGVVRLQVVT
jgi:phosphate-selective porin OprO/OprP